MNWPAPKMADVVKELKKGDAVYVLKEDGGVTDSVVTTAPRMDQNQWVVGVAGFFGTIALDRVTPKI